MRKDVITTTEWVSLEEAKSVMEEHKINSLPVIKNDKLIGIITSKDI